MMDSDPKTVLMPGGEHATVDAVREAVSLRGRRLILASLLLAGLAVFALASVAGGLGSSSGRSMRSA